MQTMGFYVLRPRRGELFGRYFAYADLEDPVLRGTTMQLLEACPECHRGLGPLPWLPPHRIKLSQSKRLPDFVWGAGFSLMVSERFKELYEQHRMLGILRFDPPAEVVRAGRLRPSELPSIPVYRNVIYTRMGADLDDAASGARRLETPCRVCRRSITGVDRIVLKPRSWRGADIFEAFGAPGITIVSERMEQMIREHGLTNGECIPAEEYSFDFDRRP
jgi:hypothetical protein